MFAKSYRRLAIQIKNSRCPGYGKSPSELLSVISFVSGTYGHISAVSETGSHDDMQAIANELPEMNLCASALRPNIHLSEVCALPGHAV
jgi:hypothetical protein